LFPPIGVTAVRILFSAALLLLFRRPWRPVPRTCFRCCWATPRFGMGAGRLRHIHADGLLTGMIPLRTTFTRR
jgi:threonine/homoserine efflux transporter RhtA